MLLKSFNRDLVIDREKTYLTKAASASDTSITVKAVDIDSNNNLAFTNNSYLIIGEIGTENAEIMQVNDASLAAGTTITIDRNGAAGGLRYAHAVDEPVYRIDYNQVEFSNAATETGSKTVIATVEVQPDDLFTRYEDATNTSGFGFARWKNANSGAFSGYSDAAPYVGYDKKSLFKIRKKVRTLLGDKDAKIIKDDAIIDDEINNQQADVYHDRLWSFAEIWFSFSSVANNKSYELTSRIAGGRVHSLVYDSEPLAKVSFKRWQVLHFDSNETGDPTRFMVHNNRIYTHPLLTTDASSTTLNGAITADDTTITLTSVSGFREPGRALIENEVISYDKVNSSNNQLLGCRRGLEDTTAASHSDGVTITERDFIGIGQADPTDLQDPGDKTGVPDPDVIAYGAGADLALRELQDETLHDRLLAKKNERLEKLRDKFGAKVTSQFFRIGDKDDYPRDFGGFVDPNKHPQNLS